MKRSEVRMDPSWGELSVHVGAVCACVCFDIFLCHFAARACVTGDFSVEVELGVY